MLVTMLILLGLMFWALYALGIFDQEEPSRPSQTISYLDDQPSEVDSAVSADGVPDFVGKDIDVIKTIQPMQTVLSLSRKEDYNEEYSKNIVYDQEPAQGTPMPNKGYVTLYVSKGSEMVSMPGLTGKYPGICN